MIENNQANDRASQDTQTPSDAGICIRPAVDIYEDERGIVLKADLPGVSADRLDIRVDGDTLSIEGQAMMDAPEGMEALYADVKCTRFRRSFTLSRELDAHQIGAEMTDGVLTLVLPKRAEVRPRKIEINVG